MLLIFSIIGKGGKLDNERKEKILRMYIVNQVLNKNVDLDGKLIS